MTCIGPVCIFARRWRRSPRMIRSALYFCFLLATTTPSSLAQKTVSCGNGQLCPSAAPCCSQFGQCGAGAYCLSSCDPVNSFSLDSCMPTPVCKSQKYDFNNLDGIAPNAQYLSDSSTADWVSSGSPLSQNGQVLLTMAQGTVGTLLTSTHYVWYGKTIARLSTSAGAGVATAFILLGDTKDEIDFEFVGVELTTAQTNFYSQGVVNYRNNENATGLSDVHQNTHSYEIDWKPDSLTWSIDGNVVRLLNRVDTWNATANRYSYPQTPARVQLSLWPAGLPSNDKAVIDWAGGLVDWNSQYMTNGLYTAALVSVDVQCYDPPLGANVQGSASYIYTDKAATNKSIEITNKNNVLQSGKTASMTATSNYATASLETASVVHNTASDAQSTSSSSNTQPSDNATSQNSQSGGSGYSESDKISLGVGIGIGLPTLIATVVALWRRSNR